MTQGDLAEATGIMQKSISRYETGVSLPSLETLEKIAKALKKTFGYFLDEGWFYDEVMIIRKRDDEIIDLLKNAGIEDSFVLYGGSLGYGYVEKRQASIFSRCLFKY